MRKNSASIALSNPEISVAFFWALGFWVEGLGFRVWGSGFRVQGLGIRVEGLGFRV